MNRVINSVGMVLFAIIITTTAAASIVLKTGLSMWAMPMLFVKGITECYTVQLVLVAKFKKYAENARVPCSIKIVD